MIFKEYNKEDKNILVLCDKNLIGTVLEEGDKIIDLTSDYYKGKDVNEMKIDFKKYNLINAIGENVIKLLIEKKIITKDHIKMISNVPYTLVIFD
jgi:hypothetical protein